MSYDVTLFVHVLAAVMLMGGTVAVRLGHHAVLDASQLAALRGALDVVRRIGRANPVLALLLLASGAYLGTTGLWATPWFWVSLATWIANGVLAARIVVPAAQAIGAAAAAAGDGAVPTAIDAMRRAPRPAIAHDVMIGLDLGTLAIMIAKPEWLGATLTPLLGVALMLGCRAVAGARRRPGEAATAASA